ERDWFGFAARVRARARDIHGDSRALSAEHLHTGARRTHRRRGDRMERTRSLVHEWSRSAHPFGGPAQLRRSRPAALQPTRALTVPHGRVASDEVITRFPLRLH